MIETLQVKKEADPFMSGFDRVETDGAAQQPSWVSSLRKAGISRFAEFGFPTVKDENWRFTNVAPIAKLPFRPALVPQPHGIPRERLEQFHFSSLKSSRLVFVDGHYAEELSSVPPMPAGVEVMNLK